MRIPVSRRFRNFRWMSTVEEEELVHGLTRPCLDSNADHRSSAVVLFDQIVDDRQSKPKTSFSSSSRLLRYLSTDSYMLIPPEPCS